MTTVVQTTYRPELRLGFPGMVADETLMDASTYICMTPAGIPFGRAVTAGGGTDKGAVIGGTSKFLGITVADITQVPVPINPLSNAVIASDIYQYEANMAVMAIGHIWAIAQSDVNYGDPVYFEGTGGTLSNSASGTAPNASITYNQNPANNDTLSVGTGAGAATTVWTWVTTLTTGNQLLIGADISESIANAVTTLSASADANTAALVYEAAPPSPAGEAEGIGYNGINFAAKAVGTAGNSYPLSTTTAGATVTGFAGGVASATLIANAMWRKTAIAGDLSIVALNSTP